MGSCRWFRWPMQRFCHFMLMDLMVGWAGARWMRPDSRCTRVARERRAYLHGPLRKALRLYRMERCFRTPSSCAAVVQRLPSASTKHLPEYVVLGGKPVATGAGVSALEHK